MTSSTVIEPTARDVLDNSVLYAEKLLKIRDKASRIVPLRLNRAQRQLCRAKQRTYDEGRPRRFIILKARQQGITTFEQAMNFHEVATKFNRTVVTLSHKADSTEKIFRIANLFYDMLPKAVRPRRLAPHNKRNMNFPGLNSYFDIGTAGSGGFGRGDTVNRAHLSEMAWWEKRRDDQHNTIVAIDKAADRGEICIESTANGIGNLFYEMWQEAKDPSNPWTGIFSAWWNDLENQLPLTDEQEMEVLESYTDEEKVLAFKHKLTAQQIAWRRAEKHRLKGLFSQEQPEDDITCFLVSGVHYFDLLVMRDLVPHCDEPIEVKENGHLRIWKQPEKGHRYVAGADTAEGTPHGDYSGVGVLDVDTCEQVADFHARVSPEVLAEKGVDLCKKYNNALLAIEANNHGHSSLNTAKNTLYYGNLFKHRSYDATGTKKLGWQTNEKTRPIMLSGLKKATEDRLMKVNDREFIAETMVFQRNNNSSKYEASSGHHDDRIIKWAIAWQARGASMGSPTITWI